MTLRLTWDSKTETAVIRVETEYRQKLTPPGVINCNPFLVYHAGHTHVFPQTFVNISFILLSFSYEFDSFTKCIMGFLKALLRDILSFYVNMCFWRSIHEWDTRDGASVVNNYQQVLLYGYKFCIIWVFVSNNLHNKWLHLFLKLECSTQSNKCSRISNDLGMRLH